jgi:hypothetical protein
MKRYQKAYTNFVKGKKIFRYRKIYSLFFLLKIIVIVAILRVGKGRLLESLPL